MDCPGSRSHLVKVLGMVLVLEAGMGLFPCCAPMLCHCSVAHVSPAVAALGGCRTQHLHPMLALTGHYYSVAREFLVVRAHRAPHSHRLPAWVVRTDPALLRTIPCNFALADREMHSCSLKRRKGWLVGHTDYSEVCLGGRDCSWMY